MRRPGYAREAGVEGVVTFEYAAAGQVLSMVFEKLPGREGSVPSASAGGFSTFKASCTGSPPGRRGGGLMVFERLLERESGFTSVFGAYEGWTAEGFARWPGRAMSGFQAHEGPAEVAVP